MSAVIAEAKKKTQRGQNKPAPLPTSEEMDSENTASAYETDSNSDDSSSESTITDSSPEDSAPFPSSLQLKSSRGGKKTKPVSGYKQTSEEALDLFISVAEALNNIVPPEIALHDHSYALPPSSIVNNMELQGTSGLSLIAAAAAVVSPTLSRSAASKLPSLSPVRAPRGRPPNSQRKGTSTTTSKLAPTLLSPAGTSPSVLLTEMKAAPLRSRARSAPSDRPKISTLHVPRAGSTLTRMSINSSSRTVNRNPITGITTNATVTYSKHRNESTGSPSLKSMIAFQPTTVASTSTSATTSTSSTSAFEALVNVAVAAPPAELPQNPSSSHPLSPHSKSSSPITTTAFTATPLSHAHSKDAITIGMAGSNSNASNSGGTTTAYIDVNQAINILATLTQQSGASNGSSQSISVVPTQKLLTQAPINLIGSIMAQSSKSNSGVTLTSANLKGGSKTLTATVDTLLGHLTSGISSAKNTTLAKPPSGKVKKTVTSKSEASVGKVTTDKSSGAKATIPGVPQPIQLTGTPEDLSNLNLLSSLVAAVAASQSTATPTSSVQSASPLTSVHYTSVGQPSNIHSSNKTEVKRSSDTFAMSSSDGSTLTNLASSVGLHTTTTTTTTSTAPIIHGGDDKKAASSSAIAQNSSSGYSNSLASSADDLPRSVVRTGLGALACGDPVGKSDIYTRSSPEKDMTVSLASIIPSYNPSSQSSLFLYTRSLSFPRPVTSEASTEEEDHLESATRGISELSKLLGTDSNPDSGANTRHESSFSKDLEWNPSDLLSNSISDKNTNTNFGSGLSEKSGKPYLSNLLESQIHGAGVHHPTPKLNTNSTTNSS